MAALDIRRHTEALRALLGVEPVAADDDPAPGYDGPAIWIGPCAPDPLANAHSEILKGPDGTFDPCIAALASNVTVSRGPRSADVAIEGPAGDLRRFVLTAVPQGGGVLILARETTLEIKRRQALSASREMFRDIALCAGGLAFETDAMGLMRWVGPGKPLGYGPETLVGRPAKDILLPQAPDAFDPFSAREPFEDAPVWMHSLDQGPRAMRVTVRPIIDAAGAWRGVRGHARDETGELRQARRDRFCQDVILAMRAPHGPSALLRALAAAAVEACGAASAWVVLAGPNGACAAAQTDTPCEMMRQIAARTIHEGVQFPTLYAAGDRAGLAIALRAQDQTQGALLIAGPPGGEGVSRDAQEMLRLIAPMAAVAVAHVRMTARLQSHAAQDPLTGLLNQTGWHEALDAKLMARHAGAVIAIECDRFRAFGDGLGQTASDELLIEIAGQLRALCAPDDLCARLGEADFAVWLDGAATDEANRRAETIAEAFRVASRRMSLALAVSPVIGVACVKSGVNLKAEDITGEAAQAVVQAKRRTRVRGATSQCSKT